MRFHLRQPLAPHRHHDRPSLELHLTCPLGGRLMDGHTGSLLQRGLLTCHCLLVETHEGLVLVDTGFGLRDVANPRSRISRFFLTLVSPDLQEEMTAIRQMH